MFEQYRALKAAQPDAILFFRMGDFFEMFFEDAVIGSRELELTLTSRNKNDPEPIPMAGFPHHQAGGYIQRLVDAGYRVALAEQVEDPAQAKGLVKREIVRVVTPGVAFDPTALEARSANWLAAVARGPDGLGIAFLDASTGALRATTVAQAAHAVAELERMAPREALLGPGVRAQDLGDALRGVTVSRVADEAWEVERAQRDLQDLVGADVFGVSGPTIAACGAVVRYARDTLGGRLGNVHQLQHYRADAFMVVDETTRRNLELVRTMVGNSRKGTLLALIDVAATPMGSRLLADWLAFPLLDVLAIRRRQLAVGALADEGSRRADLRTALAEVADIERISARVAQGTANPRDLSGLRRSLRAVPAIALLTADELAPHRPDDACAELLAELERTLVDDPPLAVTEGGLVRPGVSDDLDELVRLSLEGVSMLDALEARERDASGIGSLKIRKNNVFGYFMEVTTANLHKVPQRYLRKQTLSNCERYVTDELQELQDKLLGADERRRTLEQELFRQLRERVGTFSARLLTLARGLATLDGLAALAEVAVRRRWTCPVVDASRILDVVGGRHPMVEAALEDGRFVPNDLRLDPDTKSLVVLTGPNMAGKSTVLRQTALVALLAHVGSFVPAESARIGLVDRIFTRVGASDDLRRGQSTFMVEMAETASILHHATTSSLVVLDEIGRGTSTYDGLAIAWAVAEDLHDRIGCRGIFATHYHELVELASVKPRVANLQVAVSETPDGVVFLRRLKEGGASRSYGIQCAKLAGLPPSVVERATSLLGRFEKHTVSPSERIQLSLFDSRPVAVSQQDPVDPLRELLGTIDPDALTPREAHAALYRLKERG